MYNLLTVIHLDVGSIYDKNLLQHMDMNTYMVFWDPAQTLPLMWAAAEIITIYEKYPRLACNLVFE